MDPIFNPNNTTKKNINNEYGKSLLNDSEIEIHRIKRLSTTHIDNNLNNKRIALNNNSKIKNKISLSIKSDEIIHNKEFIKKFIKLQKESIVNLKKNNYKEYFLISKNWFDKLINFLKSDSNKNIKEEIGEINNEEFLVDKDLLIRLLYINDQDKNLNLIKPKYAFIETYNPVVIDSNFWEFLYNEFNGGPTVRECNDFYDTNKKIDFSKYIKINMIFLPTKNFNINLKSEKDSLKIKDQLINEIQNCNFYINKNKRVSDLFYDFFEIKNNYSNIGLFESKDYSCWIDLNFNEYNDLIKKIDDNILLIYNITNNLINKLPIDIDILNNKLINIKLFPLNIFNNEIIKNIFPNQFNNNFEQINLNTIEEINNQINNKKIKIEEIENIKELNKFPELIIIIEKHSNTIFNKDKIFNYKLGNPCNYCLKNTILTINCKCQKIFYCSYKCQFKDKTKHFKNCIILLKEYFTEYNKSFNNIALINQFSIKGIKNLGNICYINSVIQSLSHCDELCNYFLLGIYKKYINTINKLSLKGLMSYAFDFIIRKIRFSNEKYIQPELFKYALDLSNNYFKGNNQHDAHELLTFLIDSLHEDSNKAINIKYNNDENYFELDDNLKGKIEWNKFLSKNQSILIDLFYGLFKSTVRCSICKKTNCNFSIFSTLSLNLDIENKENLDKNLNITENKKILINKKNNNNNYLDFEIKILVIFLPYFTDEISISFLLPIKNIYELNHKILLLKISKILNIDPYSLYMYHISNEKKQINQIFGFNNYNIYNIENKKAIIISQLNREIIKNNLNNKMSFEVYESRINNYRKNKFINKDDFNKYLDKNKKEIINIIKNEITLEHEEYKNLDDLELINHYIDLNKIYIFTFNNYILENNKNELFDKTIPLYYPKIVIFPKNISIINLYYEVLIMNKKIILTNELNDDNISNINKINIYINKYFKYISDITKEEFIKGKYNIGNSPFILSLKINKEKNNKEIFLLLNENQKNFPLNYFLSDIKEQKYLLNEQIFLNIYWNKEYSEKLKLKIKPEKFDSFFIGLDLDSNINKSFNKNNKGKNNNNLQTQYILKIDNYFNKMKLENDNNKEISIYKLIEYFSKEELLKFNNEFFCNSCDKKVKAFKKIELHYLPKILIIQLNRFNNDNNKKIDIKVNFPINNFNLSKYISSKENNSSYDLFSVINHYGNIDFGHYNTYCRNINKNKWFLFNDLQVAEIEESTIVSKNAYILFYRKKNINKLDWKKIYERNYININFNNFDNLIDFNNDI